MASTVSFAATILPANAREIIAKDRARANKLLAGIQPHGPIAYHTKELRFRAAADDTIDVTDAAVRYTTSIGIGNPPTQYTLLIDTGSSHTWVGSQTKYTPTTTSKSTGKKVNVSYGSGSFSGTEYTDTVTLAPNLVIESQNVGVASTAQGFDDIDGILGIGPVDLTESTVGGNTPVPTVIDNLFAQGTISTQSISSVYEPATSDTLTLNGELIFGGVDETKITGDVNYVPITSTSPASQYWGIDQTISYGDSEILNSSSGVVDASTTLVLIATDAFQAYQQATGATLDDTTGLLSLSESQVDNLQSLFFNVGGVSYEMTANAQIWPRAQNAQIGGEEGKVYLVVADLGSPSGQGLDFINGFTFLQRFYSVYDATNAQFGLATTPFTDAIVN